MLPAIRRPSQRVAVCALACILGSAPLALAQVKNKFDVRIPMRDGVHLSADIWMPAEAGRYPILLVRTPYLKTSAGSSNPELGEYYARRGYVLVVQDTRGRGDSEGKFNFLFTDAEDGYDTVEWLAVQPWSNGKVGMMGASYLGTVQWLAARERPPHLVCIYPSTPTGRHFYGEGPYHGGAYMVGMMLGWINGTSGRLMQQNASRVDWDRIFKHRPLLTMDDVLGRRMPLHREFLQHPTMDAYWKRAILSPEDFRKINLPVLQVTGWFDNDQAGTFYYWDRVKAHSPSKDKQYLLVGPWTHGQVFRGGGLKIGEMEFSGDSVVDIKALHLAFFDHYLKGSAASFDFPRVRIYVTGSNQWRDETDYPPPGAQYRRLYFRSGGQANTLAGDGRLSWEAPGDEAPDRYIYNPENPVPAGIKGAHLGVDHRTIERRDDVLVYTSEVLQDPLEVIGPVFVNLHAASGARDTDFTAKILDVHPDGRAIKLGPVPAGVLRARYRNSFERTELLTPNRPEPFRIELFNIGHTFLPGHRIRIEISSSCFPHIAPNTNTGNLAATDTDWKLAHQTIYHDSQRPSHVHLPVMPGR